jgi:uncharacterized glyoxalase superfamily protein PhnB
MPTTTKQVFHPSLRYRDARAAMTFLENAFGFETKAAYEDDAGRLQHVEMTFRGGMVMFGAVRDDSDYGKIAQPPGSSAIYVVVDDADALHDRAVAAGADVVMALTDQDYGSRDFAVRDPEGNLWSFGTYDPWAA